MPTFGRVLRDLREKKLWSQQQLSEASGVHRVQIAKLETDKVEPTWETAKRLISALGASCEPFIKTVRTRKPKK